MPVLFVGHGSPENALLDNGFTRALSKLEKELPKPKAILCISAHWLTQGTLACASSKPETIHDFGGFPEELYKISYPAPGAPDCAQRLAQIVKEPRIGLDTKWGLDHGAWVVLKHMYPKADVPAFQMSIDYYRPPQYHYDLGKQLAALRDEGVLIIASGNIVHNLRILFYGDINAKPFDWAVKFDEKVKDCLDSGNHEELINYERWGEISKMAHPTPDHYYPLLYAIALQEKGEKITYPYEGFHYGSISMRLVKIG